MPIPRFWPVVIVLGLCTLAAQASFDDARSLYDAGRLEEAKKELFDLLSSPAPDAEKAAALHLLGTIGTDQEDYAWALESWSRLLRDYPESEDARQAKSKLPLVEALMECKNQRKPAVYLGPPVKQETIEPPQGAPGPPAAAPPGPAAPPSVAIEDEAGDGRQARRPVEVEPAPTPPPAGSGGTLLAGFGWPYAESQTATEEMGEFFATGGAPITLLQSDSLALRGGDAVLAQHLQTARDRGAHLLFVWSQFGYREFIRVECFAPAGDLLWKEKITGGYALSDKKVNPRLMERAQRRLQERLGGPCLAAE